LIYSREAEMATGGGGGGRQAVGRYDSLSGEKEVRNRWEVVGTPRNSDGDRRGELGGPGKDRNTRREERMSEGGGVDGNDNVGRELRMREERRGIWKKGLRVFMKARGTIGEG
jgi:hypothetical protein